MLDEFEGIFDFTPFWVKNLEKIGDFTVDATFLLGFLVDCYQTLYMGQSAQGSTFVPSATAKIKL